MNDITEQFQRFAARAPRDGDTFAEEPTKIFDPERGHLVAVTQCWQYRAGQWEAFTSVSRGAPWSR